MEGARGPVRSAGGQLDESLCGGLVGDQARDHAAVQNSRDRLDLAGPAGDRHDAAAPEVVDPDTDRALVDLGVHDPSPWVDELPQHLADGAGRLELGVLGLGDHAGLAQMGARAHLADADDVELADAGEGEHVLRLFWAIRTRLSSMLSAKNGTGMK